MINFLKRLCRKIQQHPPTEISEKSLSASIFKHISQMPPDEALRFLFRLDARLYEIQGNKAIEYGNGLHPKHRLMHYHEFFIQRIHSGDKVLDIGCGNGALTFDIAQKNAVITGIDLIAENIEKAQNKYSHPNIEYIHGDALRDLPARSYNVITLSNVLEHLPNRAPFLQHLQTIYHPDRFLIRVPLFERDWRVPLKKEVGVEWRLDRTHEIEYTKESFHDEMRNAGLNILYQEIRWGEIWAEISALIES